MNIVNEANHRALLDDTEDIDFFVQAYGRKRAQTINPERLPSAQKGESFVVRESALGNCLNGIYLYLTKILIMYKATVARDTVFYASFLGKSTMFPNSRT